MAATVAIVIALAFGVRGHISPLGASARVAFFIVERCAMKHTAALVGLAAASILGVAACGGGGGAPAAPAASQTTSASPSPTPPHTAQPGEPALIAVPGYEYTDPSSEAVATAQEFVKGDPLHFKSASAHNVLREGTEIGGIILVQMKPQYDTPAFRRAAMPAMAAGLAGPGAKVTRETIQNEKVVIASEGSDVVYIWYHAGALTFVAGNSGMGPDIRNFVEAYLKTAHG